MYHETKVENPDVEDLNHVQKILSYISVVKLSLFYGLWNMVTLYRIHKYLWLPVINKTLLDS